jgi:hypothetical protein
MLVCWCVAAKTPQRNSRALLHNTPNLISSLKVQGDYRLSSMDHVFIKSAKSIAVIKVAERRVDSLIEHLSPLESNSSTYLSRLRP